MKRARVELDLSVHIGTNRSQKSWDKQIHPCLRVRISIANAWILDESGNLFVQLQDIVLYIQPQQQSQAAIHGAFEFKNVFMVTKNSKFLLLLVVCLPYKRL